MKFGDQTQKNNIEKAIKDRQESPRLTFELCIVLKSTMNVIGGCGFRIKPNNHQRCDFGYIIHPAYWNKGYATEASNGLIDYMTYHLSISEIEATCDPLNSASIKVLRKCGLNLLKKVKNDRKIRGSMRDTCFFEMKINQ